MALTTYHVNYTRLGMIDGTAYGVVLNDREQRAALADAFAQPPYGAPPRAPVLYIKPRNTFADGSARPAVRLPDGLRVTAAATLALVFGDGGRPTGARLALDLSEPHASFFRPAIRERCRDGFLPLGGAGPVPTGAESIVTRIDGREAHRWSIDRLARSIDDLVAEIAAFMSFAAGDLLLIGLPGDAPEAGVGSRMTVESEGYPALAAALIADDTL